MEITVFNYSFRREGKVKKMKKKNKYTNNFYFLWCHINLTELLYSITRDNFFYFFLKAVYLSDVLKNLLAINKVIGDPLVLQIQ